MGNLLVVFTVMKVLKFGLESWLAALNHSYYHKPEQQTKACSALNISASDFAKTLAYTDDKYRFGQLSSLVQLVGFFVFLWLGGFGYTEQAAAQIAGQLGAGSIVTGLCFFGLLGLASMIFGLPFDYYATFVIEQKHGFNRQTVAGFFGDRVKGMILGGALGGLLLAGLLWVMEATGSLWWLWAWVVMSLFSMITSWLYPSLLAPLFNKFSPIAEGELKSEIYALAEKIQFKTSGIYIMDASRRSSHGNAYFTGLFGEKRIVLFDTLVDSMATREIVAVLAHELGHFKLNHVRWGLLRGIAMTGLLFYGLSLCLPLEPFYTAFSFAGMSNYAALVVFSLWFGLLDFFITPLSSWLSRQNEFAADAFARVHMGGANELAQALIKLREANHAMPVTHPLYSMVYYSHPPLLERIRALQAGGATA